MHIPDGYLSPQTGGLLYLVMAPLWFTASAIMKKALKARQVPYLAFGASFVFVIMMFNIPIPGGSTGHAVGGTLVAILLGPWAAMIAITVALVIQALLFGDGGIIALGANCFNMSFIMPFAGYYIYRFIAAKSAKDSMRRAIAGAVGSYAGIVASALAAGIEFGIQPILYHNAAGQALYCPYGINVAVPMMLIGHMAFFGWIEAIITFLVVRYLQREDASLIAG